MIKIFTHTKALVLSVALTAGILSTSCGDGTSASNIQVPGVNNMSVTLVQDNVIISMVFEGLQLDGGLRYNIPKYPNSYLEISPDLLSNGTLMAISVSLQDVFDTSLQQLNPATLPGGRSLPGVAGGKLPAVAFSIEKFKNMGFYLGPKVFGVFIPVKSLGIGSSIITARYYTGSNRIGNISLVGEDANGENSGILLMLDMSASTKSQLKSVAKKFD
jgi:outer membrane receptor protein involved in Fe transport